MNGGEQLCSQSIGGTHEDFAHTPMLRRSTQNYVSRECIADRRNEGVSLVIPVCILRRPVVCMLSISYFRYFYAVCFYAVNK